MAEEQAASLSKLSDNLARLTAALEQRQSAEQSRMFDYVIQANGTTTVSLPKGTGGLFVYPQQDLSPVTVDVEGLKFKFPVGTTKGVFLPCPGTAAQAAFTNTSSSAIYCRIRTLSPEYAMMFAAGMANQGQVEIIDASGNVIGSSDTAGASILAQLTAGTALIGNTRIQDGLSSTLWSIFTSYVDGLPTYEVGDVRAAQAGFNETNWDRWRNNTTGTFLASAARTATTSAPEQTNWNARGALLVLDVTVASGTGGLQVQIMGSSPSLGGFQIMSTAPTAVTATGVYMYLYYPSTATVQAVIKQVTNMIVPRQWSAQVTAGDASSYTYSLDFVLIL